jgi:membrane-associated phospholipid phosphatase
MATSTYRVQQFRELHLNTFKRIVAIAFIVGIQLLYLPTSEQTHGGVELILPFDIFPIWPIWVSVYLSCFALWIFGLTWAFFKFDDNLFRSFIIAFTFAGTIAAAIFVFFPTYVRPALIDGNNAFANLLRSVHQEYGRYDAFPSGHVYITTLMALFFSHLYPRTTKIWVTIVILVVLSTLFTGQHYIADALGGLAVGFSGYHIGMWYAHWKPAVEN